MSFIINCIIVVIIIIVLIEKGDKVYKYDSEYITILPKQRILEIRDLNETD